MAKYSTSLKNIDIRYMRRALQLAANGMGQTSPNPMVGAVIVYDNKIIGEGYHRHFGENHAEVNAIASVKNKKLLPYSTLYVTLEPCSHHGKTPPCAKFIIDNKIRQVVVGCLDPFEQVSGRGIKMLEEAGINVVTNVLEEECQQLNAPFITAHKQKRPFITLKWAQSNNGYMGLYCKDGQHQVTFSTPVSSVFVHKLRSIHDAILVGSGTVIADNPRLDCRLWDGRNPQRIVIDRRGIIPPNANLFSPNEKRTIYLSSIQRTDLPEWVEIINIAKDAQLTEILPLLYERGITSILVEGGSKILQSFIHENLWDLARIEIAPYDISNNGAILAPKMTNVAIRKDYIGKNSIIYYKNNSLVDVKNL